MPALLLPNGGLTAIHGLFDQVWFEPSRTCVQRNDETDMPNDRLYEYGKWDVS